jgi:hypothetical protein
MLIYALSDTTQARMSDLDPFIDAAARVLALEIEPDWKPGVRDNLAAGLALARLLTSFPLPDDAEPAPCYEPDPQSGGER